MNNKDIRASAAEYLTYIAATGDYTKDEDASELYIIIKR